MKYLKPIFISILILTFFGCASFNQMATPSPKTVINDFDGSIEVRQSPVSAAASMSEGWNTLGFTWLSKNPEYVYLIVGTQGITNISSVSFNIDGEIIDLEEPASYLTDYGEWSTRPFVISLTKFRQLANANTVKMKVVMIDSYTVSTFGKNHPLAVVSGKFDEFLKLIDANRK